MQLLNLRSHNSNAFYHFILHSNRGKHQNKICYNTCIDIRLSAAICHRFKLITEAVTLETVQEQGAALLRPTEDYFRDHGEYTLKTPRQEHLCRNGNPITVKEPLAEGALYRVRSAEGEFLALSRYEKGVLTSVKNFFGK